MASGLCTAVVKRVAIDNVNVALPDVFHCQLLVSRTTNRWRLYRSTNLAAGDLIQLWGMEAFRLFGKTYRAMSPLLLALSINILVPHTRAPEKAQPYGPSQVS